MKVCLVNPPSPFLVDQRTFVPLGLLYVASVCEALGHVVEVVDLAGYVNWDRSGFPDDAQVYGVTCTTAQAPYAIRLGAMLRQFGRTIVGGPHATVSPQELTRSYGSVVVGECELDLEHILSTNEKVYRCRVPYDLDAIPFPARHLIDMGSYSYRLDGKRATNMVTQRGCPFNCHFCSRRPADRIVRHRSVPNVLAEIRQLMVDGYGGFVFFDDTFNTDNKRVEELCKALEPLGIVWRCLTRADTLNPSVLKAMAESGCVEVGLGVESWSKKILRTVGKHETPRQINDAIRWAHESGIRVKVFMIIGLPGETRETVEETRKGFHEARPDDFDMTIFQPTPGSLIYEYPERYDIRFERVYGWYKGRKGEYRCTVSTSALSAGEIERLRDELAEEFEEVIGWKGDYRK